jgi:hypothetical protein
VEAARPGPAALGGPGTGRSRHRRQQFGDPVAYDLAATDRRYKSFRAQSNARHVFSRDHSTCQAGFRYRGAPPRSSAA